MGWFDEQIRARKESDRAVFEDSFLQMAGAVMGKRMSEALNDDRQVAADAIGEILKYYHVTPQEVPETIKDMNEVLEFLLRPYGIMRRNVTLDDGWYKDASCHDNAACIFILFAHCLIDDRFNALTMRVSE